jgi:Ricin-type beta-trefoil lectin domain-like
MRRNLHLASVGSVGSVVVFSLALLTAGCVEQGEPTPKTAPAPAAPPPEPARAALTISPDAVYTITALAANKCVQPAGQSTTEGSRAQIANCDGSPAQQFRLQAVAGGYHALINVRSSLCVEVAGASTDNGAGIQQGACRPATHQQWIIADAPGGTVRFVARPTGKVIDVQGAATAAGTNLIQWPWSGDPNQRFKLTPAAAAAATPTPDAGAAGKDGGAQGPATTGKGKGEKTGKHRKDKDGKSKDGKEAKPAGAAK